MPLVGLPSIELARVRLRPVAEADLPALLGIHSDVEVVRFLGHGQWQGLPDAEAWFQRVDKAVAEGSALELVIVGKESDAVMGRCALFDFEEGNAQARVGYTLGRGHWGQGYMREALTGLISDVFGRQGLRRLEASVEVGNVASVALLRRLGFTREGVLRERWVNGRVTVDAEIYGLLKSEWPGRR